MAKIKMTAFLADMRGKVNGTVFSKNRYGAYARTKVTPVNPQTTYQAQVRSRLTGNSQAWRGLTPAQRQAWNDATVNFPRTNIFGDQITLSGQTLYNSINNNLINVGEAALSTPPTPGSVTAITSATLTMAAGAQSASLAFAPSPVPADVAYLLFATPGVSPGKTFVKNLFRQIDIIDEAGTTPENMAAAYIAKFGAVPAAGQKVFVYLLPINKVTGQAGQAFIVSTIVAA